MNELIMLVGLPAPVKVHGLKSIQKLILII